MAAPRYLILVVENEPVIRETLAEGLENAGYRAACASNGQEALDYLKEHPLPDLILLDNSMPVMSGAEFRELQRAEPTWAQVPVVVMDASGDKLPDSFEWIAGRLGKPVPMVEILGMVDLVLYSTHAD